MKTLLNDSTTMVELGDSLAGSYCGRLFLQLGADVVKVEPPGGSPLRGSPPLLHTPTGQLSATFTALNAGKQTIRADLAASQDRGAIEKRLRENSEVVVILSGTSTEWTACGFSADEILQIAPRAVIGRVTVFGDEGPYAGIVGGELQAQALGGLMNMVGESPREPLRIGGFQAQYSTGLAMLSGFALGMFRRTLTGLGSSFSTSVIETVSHIEWKSGLSYQADGTIVTRGSDGAPAILRAKDGFFAFFYRPGDWPKVVALLKDPRLETAQFATQEDRDRNRPALLRVLNECTSRLSKRELYHMTQAGRMTTGYMATMGDLLESEQYRARGFLEEVDLGSAGSGVLPTAPWRLVGGSRRRRSDANVAASFEETAS